MQTCAEKITLAAWQAIDVRVLMQEASSAYEEHYDRIAKELSLPQLGFFGGPLGLWLHICSEHSQQLGLRLAQPQFYMSIFQHRLGSHGLST